MAETVLSIGQRCGASTIISIDRSSSARKHWQRAWLRLSIPRNGGLGFERELQDGILSDSIRHRAEGSEGRALTSVHGIAFTAPESKFGGATFDFSLPLFVGAWFDLVVVQTFEQAIRKSRAGFCGKRQNFLEQVGGFLGHERIIDPFRGTAAREWMVCCGGVKMVGLAARD